MRGLVFSAVFIWLFSIFSPTVPLGVMIILYMLYSYSFNREYKKLMLFTLLSPFIVLPLFFLVKGGVDYCNGNAIIIVNGNLTEERWNLDPELRMRKNYTPSLAFNGLNFFLDKTNNFIIRKLTNAYGYQRGTYVGVYPSMEESQKYLSQSNEFMDVKVDDEIEINFNNKNISDVIMNKQNRYAYNVLSELNSNFKSPYVLLKEECLIFKFRNDIIFLLDINEEELIAAYYLE